MHGIPNVVQNGVSVPGDYGRPGVKMVYAGLPNGKELLLSLVHNK